MRLAFVLLGLLLSTSAFAQNTGGTQVTPRGDSVNGVVPYCLNSSNQAVPCGTSGASLTITSSDSGAKWQTGTGNSVSHTAGQSIGGLFQVPVPRVSAGSGIVTNFNLFDTGGSTNQLLIRIWQNNPTNTTCTDNSAFAGSSADDKQLITIPFPVTPAAPVITTGDAKTYASNNGVTWDYAAGATVLYVCVVTVSTQTVAGSAFNVMLSGPQN